MRHRCLNGVRLSLIALLLLAGGSAGALELHLESQRGHYAGVLSTSGSPPVGEIHSWKLSLTLPDGSTFLPGILQFSGGMPGHGHGLPTEPTFTRLMDDGRFLLEGVKFNMTGSWELTVTVVGPEGLDLLSTELLLGPPQSEIETSTALTKAQWDQVRTFDLTLLGPPMDPSNRFLGHPSAIRLGEVLFNDKSLSGSKEVSCASCHQRELFFTDGKKTSMGSKRLNRNAPSLIGTAHWNWYYWDGRRDSLWAQALTPLETPGEMDNTRTGVVAYVTRDDKLRQQLEKTLGREIRPLDAGIPATAGPFGDADARNAWHRLPPEIQREINEQFATIGKALAAYQSTLDFEANTIDHMIATNDPSTLSDAELAGLQLFLDAGKTQCLRCHNGPRYSNGGFHNVGTAVGPDGNQDFGRMLGLQAVWYDPFRCDGSFSDAGPDDCRHLLFAPRTQMPMTLTGAFKVPTLRNVAGTAPYFHDGRFETLEEVMAFYLDPPDQSESGHELPPLDLTEDEVAQMIAFLKVL